MKTTSPFIVRGATAARIKTAAHSFSCILFAALLFGGGDVWAQRAFIPRPPAAPLAPDIKATQTDAYPSQPGSAHEGETITYTTIISNVTGTNAATGVQLDNTTPANTTDVVGSVKVSPLAFPETFDAAKAITTSIPVAGVLSNDTGVPAPSAVPIAGGATAQGGTVTLNANGSLDYTPPNAAFTGTDTFTYTATNGVPPPSASDSMALVTMNVLVPPVANPDNYNATINTTLSVPAPGVSLNDVASSATITSYGINGNEQTTIGNPTATSQAGMVSLNADGSFTYNPATNFNGTDTFKYTITNLSGSSTATVTLSFAAAPQITSANNTAFTINTAGSFTVTTTGSPSGAAMMISETGALPGGVTFVNNNDGTATLAGTPTASGSFPITITANNGVAPNATQNFTLTVQQAPAITSANNTTFKVGTPGTFMVTTTGFPTNASMMISETGALPGGVTFVNNNDGTATLAGTPTASGSFPIIITANNGVAPNATQNFTLTVQQAPAITSANNATFKVGTAGTFTVTTTGFPTNASMAISETGALPGGVTFVNNNNGTATLAGTPAAGTGGTYPITITASNGVAPDATQNFTLTVQQAPAITSANNVTFTTGIAGTFSVTTTGFPTNASMAISETGALPGGVTFVNNNNGTATLAGTPNANTGGTYPIVITANNGVTPNATQNFTLTVNQPPVASADNPAIINANTTLTGLSSGPTNLLTNDSRGFPIANISSYGGGSMGGSVTDHAAGTTTSPLPTFATGSIVVNADGSYTFTPPTGFTGTYTFQYRLSNVAGNSDATVTVQVRPVAANDTFGPPNVIGNVSINIATSVFLANDIFNNPVTFNLVSNTTTQGGSITIAGTTLTYNPPRGYEGADTFTYTITDNSTFTSTSATVTMNVSGMIWFINNNAGACSSTCDGRLSNPYTTLAAFNTANGLAGGLNPDNNDNIFVYESATGYSGAVTLRTGQKLIGQDATASLATITGLTVPSGSTLPVMNSGNGTVTNITSTVTINTNVTVRGLQINSTTTTGMNDPVAAITGVSVSEVSVTTTTGTGVDFSGTSGTLTFAGLSTSGGAGANLVGNSGGTFNFSNIAVSSGANAAFTATGGGTVNATQNNTSIVNTLASTTGTALNVANTTIGVNGLTFRSISSNGAANGIILNTTGATGSLTVTGNVGTCTSAVTCTGGAIQSSATGVSLNSTTGVSIDRMLIQTASDNGVSGVGVTNFTFTNGKIDSVGNANFESCISFNGNGTGLGNNIAGTLTITGNSLTNAYYSGVDVQSDNGTVTNANISNNTITTTNQGLGINFNGQNNASTAFNLQNATINQNNISGIGGTGIQAQCSSSSATGPAASCGTPGDGTKLISITNNSVLLQPTATQGITITSTGGNSGARAKGNFLVQCNGRNTGGCTAPTATALGSSSQGTVILIGNNGFADMAATIDKNTVMATQTPNLGGGNGIAGGNGVAGAGNAWTPTLTLSVTNNFVRGTDGNMILLVGRGTSGFANMKITGNDVGTPANAGGTAREGIRIDAGNAASADDGICVTISGNTCAIGSNGAAGIGIRKQGTIQTTNDFGITGLAPSPATGAQAAAYVVTQNPAGNGCDNISGSNFQSCATAPPLLLASGGVQAKSDRVPPVRDAGNMRATLRSALAAVLLAPFSVSEAAIPPMDRLPVSDQMTLSQAELDSTVAVAAQRWAAAGLTAEQFTILRSLRFEVADLPALKLGEADGNRIRVSRNAGGNRWFISSTARDDKQFSRSVSATRSYTEPTNTPAGRVDLLTAVMHEMGHALGLPDTYDAKDRDKVMYGFLTNGERRVPATGDAASVKPVTQTGPQFLEQGPANVSVSIPTIPAGKSVTVIYQVTVNTPVTPGTTNISSQGMVSGTNFPTVSTDDPDAGGANDPTLTPVVFKPRAFSAGGPPPNGTVGTVYAGYTFIADGNPAPTYAVQSGTLPPGLSLSSSGALSGTPTTAGTFGPIVVRATNSEGFFDTAGFSITISSAGTNTNVISASPVSPSLFGQAVTFTATVTPMVGVLEPTGTVTFKDGGTTLGTGTLADNGGTATATFTTSANQLVPGPHVITADYAGDGNFGGSTSGNFPYTVNQAPAITSANSTTFGIGAAGSFTVTTTGFPSGATMVISETGALPNNVTFTNNNDGTATIAGTPAAGTGGSYPITITANNGVGSQAQQSFTLIVNQAPQITSANNTTFTATVAGTTFQLTASGFPTSFTFTNTGNALPSGLTLSSSGLLSGTPAAGTGGVYNLAFRADNGVNPAGTQNFTLTVLQAPAITSANTALFKVGSFATFTVTTNGYPTAATISSMGALPGGVNFTNNGDGTATLAGTPNAGTSGTYPLTITASNGVNPQAQQSFTLTVGQQPAITSANSTTFKVGTAGTFTVTTTGFPTGASMSISEAGALPGGVTFVNNNDGTATLSGTPAAGTGGIYPFTITANNGVTPNATQSFTLTVQQAPAVTSANSTTFQEGAAGTFAVTTTGFPSGASMAISETGALPSGVTFVNNNDGTATLAGTPGAGTNGSYPLTITANNGVTPSANQLFTLTVSLAPTPTPTPTPTATPAPTATPTPTPTPSATPAQALNISTRLRVDIGDKVMIAGFIITGNASKPVVMRGLGRSLINSGVPAATVLNDPVLELHGPNGALITMNDNWKDSPQKSLIEGTVFEPTDDNEAVILATLAPGSYTALLRGAGQTTGVGLVEVYDNNQAVDSDLANISTRGFVQTGNEVMIGGFTLGGNNNPTRIAVRALGPSLTSSGLSNVLADPTLELHNANGTIMVSNDDWESDAVSAGQLTLAGLALPNPKEAGIFTSLAPPGQFTAILAGKNGGVGIGLVEIYNLK